MSDDFNSSSSSKSSEFVDIHGRDISIIIGENGDILVPLNEIKKTGFGIYKKSQHNKLVISDKQFNDEFNLYMLEAAKSYMLTNRISFQPEDVLRSIENCKKLLTAGNKSQPVRSSPKPSTPAVRETRSVVENGNDDFQVQVNQPKTDSQPPLSIRNLQEHNKNNNRENLEKSTFDSSENGVGKSPSSALIRSPHADVFKQKWKNRNEAQSESSENGSKSTLGGLRSPHENTFKQKWNNNRNETLPEKAPFNSSENGNVRSPSGAIRSPHENSFKPKWNNNRNETASGSPENGIRSPSGPAKSPYNNTHKPKYNNPNETIPRKPHEYQNIPEKLPVVPLSGVHIVTVTHYEKENIIWGREKKYDDLLEKIHNEVSEDAKKQDYANNFLLNSLYLAEDNNEWYRCRVVRFKPQLTVNFVDYGNVVETDRIKTISEKLTKYPCLANRMAFRGLPPAVGMDIEIKVVKCYDDGTYPVSILNRIAPKTPTVEKPATFQTVAEEKIAEFNIRPKLTHGERVTVIHEENGTFYLRNQKGYINLNKINEVIKNTKLIPVSIPKVKEMVLCKKRNELNEFTYCRGIIKKFDEDLAEVEFLDYNETCLSSLDTLMQAPKSLHEIEGTFLTLPQLAGYKNKMFTAIQRDYIENKINSRQKYTVIVQGSDFDLQDSVCCLSKHLLDLESSKEDETVKNKNTNTVTNANNVLMLNEISVYKPKMGLGGYMCTYFKDIDHICFVSSEALDENIKSVFIDEISDSRPYKPIVGEVCFGQYNDDSWNRCAVSRVVGDKFEVVFIDFGNIEIITPAELRKATPECKIVPALSIPCQFVDLPRTEKVISILKELIVEHEIYNVEIKAFKNGKYEIIVPSVYDELRAVL